MRGSMAEVKFLNRDSTAPTGDFVAITRRIAPNNTVVTDIICMKDGAAVKTITDRQFRPDAAIETAQEIADEHDVEVVYMLDLA